MRGGFLPSPTLALARENGLAYHVHMATTTNQTTSSAKERAISLRERREAVFRNTRDSAALFRAAQRTSTRIMAADAPGQKRPSASRRLVHRKAAYPNPPPRQYRRVGVSYLRRQQTADGIRTTSFHQKVSPCSDAGKAIAHMDYIERENAVVASIGTISDDPEERRALWTELADRATPSRGTITLPENASPELRRALQPILDDLARGARVPRRAAAAWLRRAKHPLRIRGLHPDAYNDLAAAIAGAYQRGIDPQFLTEPAKAGQPCALPTKAGIRGYIPRAPTVQMRMILELPHDVTPLAREQILRNYCDQQFRDRGIPYHAVIHKPAEGNDARNYHAHIVWTHHRVARDPVTREWDFLASRTLPRVHDFGRVLTCAARGPDGKPLPYAERRKAMSAAFRQMRQDFAVIANEQLTNHAAHRRYDPRSYADRGIDATPSIHVGPAATAAASKPRPSASPAAPGRNPHLAAWHNFAAAAADHLPDEDRDEITAAVATEMLASSLPATLINHEFIDQQQKRKRHALLDRIRKVAWRLAAELQDVARRRRPRVQSAATLTPVRDRAALKTARHPAAELQDVARRHRPRVQSAAPMPVRDRAALKTARHPAAELQDVARRHRPRVQSAAPIRAGPRSLPAALKTARSPHRPTPRGRTAGRCPATPTPRPIRRRPPSRSRSPQNRPTPRGRTAGRCPATPTPRPIRRAHAGPRSRSPQNRPTPRGRTAGRCPAIPTPRPIRRDADPASIRRSAIAQPSKPPDTPRPNCRTFARRRRPRVQSAATPTPVRDPAALKTARHPAAELQDVRPATPTPRPIRRNAHAGPRSRSPQNRPTPRGRTAGRRPARPRDPPTPRPIRRNASPGTPVRDPAALKTARHPAAELQDVARRRRPRVQSAATLTPVRDPAALKTARHPAAELQDVAQRRRPRVQSAATLTPVRDPAALETAPAITSVQALAQHLHPHLPAIGDAILHALHRRSSLHLPPLPGIGPEATHRVALALAPYVLPHSPDHPSREHPEHAIRRWRTHFDTGLSPRAIRTLPQRLAHAALPVHQHEQAQAHLASPRPPRTAGDTRALLAPHLYALVTATILGPYLQATELPPVVPGLAPDAIAAAMRLLRKPLHPHVPGRFLDAISAAHETAREDLDDIASRIHHHGRSGTLHLLAPPNSPRRPRGRSVQR